MCVLFNQTDSSLHFCHILHSTDTQAAVHLKMQPLPDCLWELKEKRGVPRSGRAEKPTLIAGEMPENLSAGHVDDLADFGLRPASDIVPLCRTACSQRGAWNVEMLSKATKWGLFYQLWLCDTSNWRISFEEKAVASLYDGVFWKRVLHLDKTTTPSLKQQVSSFSKIIAWGITLQLEALRVLCRLYMFLKVNGIEQDKQRSWLCRLLQLFCS